MRSHLLALTFLALAPLASAACQTNVCTAYEAPAGGENNIAPAGFTNLFNGKTIDYAIWTGGTTHDPRRIAAMKPEEKAKWFAGHEADIRKNWSVDTEKHELVSNGHGSHLATKKMYGDFELWVDWKLMKDNGDSGIYLRGAPQVQIWNPDNPHEVGNGAPKGSGGIWNNGPHQRFPMVRADHKIGEWNRFHITMVKNHVWVELNGKLVTDTHMDNYFNRKLDLLPAESIQLQTHGSEVRFRNIFVREIGADEAAKRLAQVPADKQ